MKKQSDQKPPIIATLIILCILFSILSYIWEKFHTVIIIVAIFAIVLFIGYIISILEKRKDKNPEISDFAQSETTQEAQHAISIDFSSSKSPGEQIKEQTGIDLGLEYVRLSTAGDERVCPMCAQFEGKVFLSTDAPELPLCPTCSCDYEYYLKEDLPSNVIISNKNDFVLPAKCTALFYKHQQELYTTTDIDKQIRLCEADLKKLPEFMAPYLSAGFPAPAELACRDLLPDLYMQLGKWDKAEKAINKCIDSKAYFPDNGSEQLKTLATYKKIATETLGYISQNPGCLQRNIYKKMGFEGEEKEILKDFVKNNKLLKKEKYNNTYKLFCNTDK